ncbi:MAG: siderophore-interacting protein [Pantoea sp.]|jgi:ferric-chelate reductase (NADPH)|uniref:siderophore-interacting protein n=1 Tax=Pantoea TaxID=53335 RepID=UPI0006612568|nr:MULTISPECIES: siderophore-interacting protein [Pantoea]MBS6438674.1 siderophore-interacting protein [Pantoea sp.]MDU1574097.1 siderophore-interacting protein [Pantoea sp.]MDU2731248.1 siderophore-interacting protein [Pantoea sp.]MDU6078966.1 siderophore-interacting protein [Pantoea sp.]MDU7838783.1 siderophore-interacting protein [Pantoea sp.]
MHSDNRASRSRAPQRVRNELRFRRISVASKTLVAGEFWRVVFHGSDLAGFASPGFDDHIKLFFPQESGAELPLPQMTDEGVVWADGARPPARDYTPLAFDGESSLTIDFYIHEGGVASSWAQQAQEGDRLIIGGPRGSLVVPTDYAFQLYVCDETSLPAFKRRVAAAEAQEMHLFACVDEATGRDYLPDLAGVNVRWLGSGAAQSGKLEALIAELDNIRLPQEDYFIWLTGEGAFTKALGDYFVERRGLDAAFVRAVAYWHAR